MPLCHVAMRLSPALSPQRLPTQLQATTVGLQPCVVRAEAGEGYAVNVPLKDGIDDTTYRELFRPIITRIMEVYQPDAVVFQCGATDSPFDAGHQRRGLKDT